MRKRRGEFTSTVLLFITGVHVFMASIIFGGMETKLIYQPIDKEMKDIWINIDKKIRDTYFFTGDGVKLNGWYVKAEDNKPTIVYCHGQGENISNCQPVIRFLADNGYGVMLVEYRGHGRSDGTPFESGLYMDLESAVKYLTTYEGVDRNNIILWGRSLGGAIVADVASRYDFKAVILESTFTDIRKEALHLTGTHILEPKFGFWTWLSSFVVKVMPITQKFETEKKIHKIKSPLLIGHSIHDTTVPVEMSYRLKAMNDSARLFISDTGSHHNSDWFFPTVLNFLQKVENKPKQDQVSGSERFSGKHA